MVIWEVTYLVDLPSVVPSSGLAKDIQKEINLGCYEPKTKGAPVTGREKMYGQNEA